MNIHAADILLKIKAFGFSDQRQLASDTGFSLGLVNRTLKNLIQEGYLTEDLHPTGMADALLSAHHPQRAIILAAGYGMRMVPVNNTPKALLRVKGERLIDRLIRQLHEVGVENITVVVGYMKEQFEYLIDAFGVELVYNRDYAAMNNLQSLSLARKRIENCYVLPCDLWCRENPFRMDELYSWYMVTEEAEKESSVRINRRRELVPIAPTDLGNHMVGIAYLTGRDCGLLQEAIAALLSKAEHTDAFWEDALFSDERIRVYGRVYPQEDVVEINTYEQLRDLDSGSDNLQSDSMKAISQALHIPPNEIQDISVLKKGMTNRSFCFRAGEQCYIMRIPGEGTNQLINRRQEASVYEAIRGLGYCDDPVWIDPETGYKITKYLPNVRVCDVHSEEDLNRCMHLLHRLHDRKLHVDHSFDLFERIEFYESLRGAASSLYMDYPQTKANCFSLKEYIDQQDKDWCLSHIDAVCDNFLFYREEGCEKESLQLTDWEYAGMQDPHVDLAMFSIYSFYNKQQVDRLIDLYFHDACPPAVRVKIYCYVSLCGLLWSNWCEYKQQLGVEFGEYSIRQYRYAKEFYRYAAAGMEALG